MTAGGLNAKPAQIRACALRMVRRDGLSIRATAEALGVSATAVREWLTETRPKVVEAKTPECVRLLAKWPNLTER